MINGFTEPTFPCPIVLVPSPHRRFAKLAINVMIVTNLHRAETRCGVRRKGPRVSHDRQAPRQITAMHAHVKPEATALKSVAKR